MLVLGQTQRGPKGHSTLWKRPTENPGIDTSIYCAMVNSAQWLCETYTAFLSVYFLNSFHLLTAIPWNGALCSH